MDGREARVATVHSVVDSNVALWGQTGTDTAHNLLPVPTNLYNVVMTLGLGSAVGLFRRLPLPSTVLMPGTDFAIEPVSSSGTAEQR